MGVTRSTPTLLVAMLLGASCGGCGPAQSASSSNAVSVRLRGSPPNASVTVDDLLVGPLDVVQARGFAVAPGKHHVSVEASGFFPRDVVVDAKDKLIVLDVALVRIPD